MSNADLLICFIIIAILSAMLPETPVSISSKMRVGRSVAPAIRDFRESITLAISPPEAICESSCNLPPLLALNKKLISSVPFTRKSLVSFRSIWNWWQIYS